jgi:hypothetical protein
MAQMILWWWESLMNQCVKYWNRQLMMWLMMSCQRSMKVKIAVVVAIVEILKQDVRIN